jgi:hypothetical protein
VKADEYVAVFGLAREAPTVADCGRTMDESVGKFKDALKALGVPPEQIYVDFVGQTEVFGYEVEGNIAREKRVGFELKKNASIHYKDPALLDRLVVAAAGVNVHDLIKVDYVVNNVPAIQDRLAEAAAAVIKRKTARYERLLGVKLKAPAQIIADRSGTYQPSEQYDSYTAFVAEDISHPVAQRDLFVQSARKTRTFFFNGLGADGFDEVINPVVVEPVVQFTQYLKVKYEVEQSPAR